MTKEIHVRHSNDNRLADRQENKWQGITSILLAMVLFAFSAALSKVVMQRHSIYEAIFFRFIFSIIPLLPFIFKTGLSVSLVTGKLDQHIFRSIAGVTSIFLYFYCIDVLPLSYAVTLSYSSPIFITVFSVVFLREPATLRRWLAVCIGFLGLLLVTQPTQFSFSTSILLGLGAPISSAINVMSLRELGRTEQPLTTTLYFTIFASLFFAIPTILYWSTPTAADLIISVGMGISAGLGQLFLSRAYKAASPSLISPFNYTIVFWTAVFGFLFWGHKPNVSAAVGITIVILIGLYLTRSESRGPDGA
jgi:drug/metabolite transporter (DMT)-like permease